MDTAARPNQRMQRDQIPPLQVFFDLEFSFGGIGRLILSVLERRPQWAIPACPP
jgi:hypothetical protein